MSNDKVELVEAVRDGRIDRRTFVLQALGLGISLGTIGSVLQACSGGEAEKPKPAEPTKGPPPKPAAPPAPPPEPPLGDMEKELRIYNWSDYIDEQTIPAFEKEFGVKVIYDNYESNEELIAKLQSGASGYDLVVPSGYAVQVLMALGLIEKLRKSYIPNLGNVAAQFRKPDFDPTGEYVVPWQWGMTGIAYRKDKLPVPPDSWAIFQDTTKAGKMTMMDDMRDVIGAWLRFRGKSVNSVNDAELVAAKADALLAKKNLASFVSAPVKAQLIAGDVIVAQLWDGDTMQAKAEKAEIEWVMPKEGTSIWLDSMVIPKAAPHKRAAHAFLDFILRPDVGGRISEYTGYGTPNDAAFKAMKAPVPYPSAEQMAKLEYQKDLGAGLKMWDRIWTEIKAG